MELCMQHLMCMRYQQYNRQVPYWFLFDSRSIGCLCPDCELCKQAQHRRCTSCFGNKYLSGDALKAKCGAPIIVEIINPQTGEVVSLDKVSDVQLEVRLNCTHAVQAPKHQLPAESRFMRQLMAPAVTS